MLDIKLYTVLKKNPLFIGKKLLILSLFEMRKLKNLFHSLFLLVLRSLLIVGLTGCYSFTGGSVPDHLKTIVIPNVTDLSNSGVPEFKDLLTDEILRNFKSDGSLKVVDSRADASLQVKITSINESITQVNPGELEKERKVQVTCRVEYFDNVKKKMIWEKDFTNYSFYNVSDGITGRNDAVRKILKNNAEDILLSVISGW